MPLFRGRPRSRSADPAGDGTRVIGGRSVHSLEPQPMRPVEANPYGYGDAPPSTIQQQYGYDDYAQQQPTTNNSNYYSSDDDMFSQSGTESFYGGNSTRSYATGSSSGMRRFFGGGGNSKRKGKRNDASNSNGRAVSRSPPPPQSRNINNNNYNNNNSTTDGPPSELRYYNQDAFTRQEQPKPAEELYSYDQEPASAYTNKNMNGPSSELDIPKRASNPRLSSIEKFNPNELIQVLPDDSYPDTYMNYSQMEQEMNARSLYYHDLRLPSQKPYELGQVRLEILQCFGLPSAQPTRDPSAYAVAVLGNLAFKTDVMPPVANPMWLCKMRRACLFPIQAAYHRLYIGIFDGGIPEQYITHRAEEFLGRICIDLSRLRPGTMYDVMLPLRQSTQVYTKQPHGCVRVRMHLMWASERNALLSYLPQKIPGGTVKISTSPNTQYTINCLDDKSFRDVAHTVHGYDMPGKFSVTVLKSTVREISFTRIHILRYLRQKQWWELCHWQYPSISLFVFCAWMHAVYFGTLRYIPGHLVLLLFLYLLKNYAYYAMDSPLQNGMVMPTMEELYWALMRGTRRRRKPYIQPLTVEPIDESPDSNAGLLTSAHGGNGTGPNMSMNSTTDEYLQQQQKFHKGYLLTEIADAMRQSVKLTPYRYKFRLYKTAFVGSDAIAFFLSAGYAYSRPEAVHLGRKLAKQFRLFDHIEGKYMLEDEPYMYYFLDCENQRYTIKQGPVPRGTKLFETLGFYSRSPQKAAGADILEAREHMEFPFATGHDHPRFTIKESLVTKSPEAKKILKEQQEAAELTDAAEFGVLAKDTATADNWEDSESHDLDVHVPHRRTSADGADRTVSNEPSGMLGAAVGATTRTVRRASLLATTTVNTAVTTAVSTAQTTVNTASTMATSAVNMATNLPNNLVSTLATPRGLVAPVEPDLQVGDPEEIYDKLRSKKNPTLDYMLERQRQANEYDPYAYDSDNDVEEVQKSKKKGVILEEKRLKKPPNQDFSRKAGKGDKIFTKTIAEARHKVHAAFYHMFNDHVYKIDKKLFPTVVKNDTLKEDLAAQKKKKGLFHRRTSDGDDKEEAERRKKAQMTPYDQKQEDLDKILAINKYSNANAWINRVAVVIQPIIEMAQAPLFLFRALFNILTWQDPMLSFWVTFLCPGAALVLYLMPYRFVFGVLGLYLVGPQNYVIRLYNESRPGYQPPDFDTIVKKKKPEKEENYHELQFFSSEAPGNQVIRFKNVDPAQVRQIVVPTNVLKYSRFYDWPPEPEYARAYASAPPRSQHVGRGPSAHSDDDSDVSGFENDAYYYDAATPRPKKKKKKKKQGLKKVAHTLKKGTQAGFDATLHATGAIYTTTGIQNVVDVAARTSTGAIKGTAKLSKKAVKGTAKNTTGLFRRKKKNNYDDDEYY
ncbi:glutamine amidotransferases class-II [Nitzschia inconspicua]|uniref:Glutamine amidotransferases class-II n=1 Tax=Nitzschia inconspicua TaxID=303405 RepID=A0A9K3PDC2_9STRA|nr:glutamine amidotransferases class-II [Nitzschia inconspicua]